MIGAPTIVSKTFNEDCMIGMARYPDKFFDLAVVDPPYGMPKDSTRGRGKMKNRALNKGGVEQWDIAPDEGYFGELFRASKVQIIWGGNYFHLPPSRGFLIWDKEQPFENFSACEYAWLSTPTVSKIYRLATTRTGENKIHPTQKPVALYDWIYKNYLPEGGKVIDTHLGSGSNRIAANKAGNIDFYGWELNKDYYETAERRYNDFIAQTRLF